MLSSIRIPHSEIRTPRRLRKKNEIAAS